MSTTRQEDNSLDRLRALITHLKVNEKTPTDSREIVPEAGSVKEPSSRKILNTLRITTDLISRTLDEITAMVEDIRVANEAMKVYLAGEDDGKDTTRSSSELNLSYDRTWRRSPQWRRSNDYYSYTAEWEDEWKWEEETGSSKWDDTDDYSWGNNWNNYDRWQKSYY